MWILFPKIRKEVFAKKFVMVITQRLPLWVTSTTREQKPLWLIERKPKLSGKRLSSMYKVAIDWKMSQTFWRSTISFQKPERKSTNPVRLLFSPILFTLDSFAMVENCTKESMSQSFQRLGGGTQSSCFARPWKIRPVFDCLCERETRKDFFYLNQTGATSQWLSRPRY